MPDIYSDPTIYVHPLMLQALLPVVFIVLCIAGLVFYAYKKGVPVSALNVEGLSPEQKKKTQPARIAGALSLLAYIGVRFSNVDNATFIYIFVLIPFSMIATTTFVVQIIRFKSAK